MFNRTYPTDIRWHQDGMKFETLRKSYEWAYSVIYNKIGNLYDGYQTEDEKIAYSLVYELTRLNTFSKECVEVYAHESYSNPGSTIVYRVWVEKPSNTPLYVTQNLGTLQADSGISGCMFMQSGRHATYVAKGAG